ncbi:universal stress protein [Streptomyces griseus]|uniref:universal stress protein n=1 Tax=Streptomyces TaxID=1883 RepID=UPI0029C2C3D7|nr:universal stress protein [Streptomyces sp. ID01-9D]MDX5576703.1 universal stress protein [Streptomyces sp. ID01-9D]WTC85562.1 universal stress protein [Streptomyces griseus]WTD71820.1 universal stress protein [Streptomyces griseus]
MDSTETRQEIVVGVDPRGGWQPAVAWGADEAQLRRLQLRLALSVPPRGDTRYADDSPHHRRLEEDGRRTLTEAISWAQARSPEAEVTGSLLDGYPGRQLALLSREVRLLVLGTRRLRRVEEILSSGSVVVPVTAQAGCPVVVVGDGDEVGQDPPYLVVGVDGSEASGAALALAFEEADLRRCALHAIAVWQPPVFTLSSGDTLFHDERRHLSGTLAGWREKYPDVELRPEVRIGSPVEVLAEAGERALGMVVGRRGQGGYTGMKVGSVVHGLLHRARCPVITVPAP